MIELMSDTDHVEVPKMHFASVLYGLTVGFLFIPAGFGPLADNFCRHELKSLVKIMDDSTLMGQNGDIVAWNQAMAAIIIFSGVFSILWRLVMMTRHFENLRSHVDKFKKTSFMFWAVHVLTYVGFSIWGVTSYLETNSRSGAERLRVFWTQSLTSFS